MSNPLPRITSIDALRGFVMLLMLNETLHLGQVAKSFPDNEIWQWVRFHTTHVEWRGCSLHWSSAMQQGAS
jgi:uncharacterized membrane protein